VESRKGIIGRKKLFFILAITFAVILADQIIKLLMNSFLELGKTTPIINKVLHLTLVYNKGAAFGILQNSAVLLVFAALIMVGIIIYFYGRIPKITSVQVYVSLILGGTISNLIDRIRLSYVIDFIDFRIWPAFNLADAAITIGAIGLIIYLVTKKK
jgi:signal peptidase II